MPRMWSLDQLEDQLGPNEGADPHNQNMRPSVWIKHDVPEQIALDTLKDVSAMAPTERYHAQQEHIRALNTELGKTRSRFKQVLEWKHINFGHLILAHRTGSRPELAKLQAELQQCTIRSYVRSCKLLKSLKGIRASLTSIKVALSPDAGLKTILARHDSSAPAGANASIKGVLKHNKSPNEQVYAIFEEIIKMIRVLRNTVNDWRFARHQLMATTDGFFVLNNDLIKADLAMKVALKRLSKEESSLALQHDELQGQNAELASLTAAGQAELEQLRRRNGRIRARIGLVKRGQGPSIRPHASKRIVDATEEAQHRNGGVDRDAGRVEEGRTSEEDGKGACIEDGRSGAVTIFDDGRVSQPTTTTLTTTTTAPTAPAKTASNSTAKRCLSARASRPVVIRDRQAPRRPAPQPMRPRTSTARPRTVRGGFVRAASARPVRPALERLRSSPYI